MTSSELARPLPDFHGFGYKIAQIENNTHCNYKCWFCPNAYDTPAPKECMSLDLFKKILTEIMASTDKLVITQSWLNKAKKGESHHEHGHPNSMVSGVWYPQIHEQLPPIQFRSRHQRDVSLQTEKYNTFNSATFMLPMKRGELILFPSNLQHSVPVNRSDEERISLSFNSWPKGNMGDIKSLTYLPLDRCV